MKTPEEYIESIKRLDRKVYLLGKRVEQPAEHPMLKPSLNAIKLTYQLALEEDHAPIMRSSRT